MTEGKRGSRTETPDEQITLDEGRHREHSTTIGAMQKKCSQHDGNRSAFCDRFPDDITGWTPGDGISGVMAAIVGISCSMRACGPHSSSGALVGPFLRCSDRTGRAAHGAGGHRGRAGAPARGACRLARAGGDAPICAQDA